MKCPKTNFVLSPWRPSEISSRVHYPAISSLGHDSTRTFSVCHFGLNHYRSGFCFRLQEALKIKSCIFGEKNLNVAVIHEDLAYALYVYEYSRGHFNLAQFYVEKAIEIMSELAPSNHIMLASAKRVKALILEEIALDNMVSQNSRDYKGLLKESEDLHRSALQLSLDAFGEINVQTAKHYGNLGRLYQSMTKYDDAEEMHQRAIKIKRDLLGDYDYEVGLSIGHLASLYNYHMKKYREAEELYLKSIHISKQIQIAVAMAA